MMVVVKVVVQTEATTTDLLLLSCSQLKGDRVVETREGSPPQKAAPHRPPAAAHLPLQPPSLLPSSSSFSSSCCCCSAASLPARPPPAHSRGRRRQKFLQTPEPPQAGAGGEGRGKGGQRGSARISHPLQSDAEHCGGRTRRPQGEGWRRGEGGVLNQPGGGKGGDGGERGCVTAVCVRRGAGREGERSCQGERGALGCRTRGRGGRKPAGKFSGGASSPAATPLAAAAAAASAPRGRPRLLLTGKLGGSVDFRLLPPPQLDPK